MASTFPGAIDSFTDPLSGSALNSPSHSAQHADLNDAAEKLETYMGLVKVIPTGATNGTVGATGTVTTTGTPTTLAIDGCFSSLYENYRIVVKYITPGTGFPAVYVNWRVGGVNAATATYAQMGTGRTSANTDTAYGSAGNTNAYVGSIPGSFSFDVLSPFNSAVQTTTIGQSNFYDGTNFALRNTATFHNVTAAYDGLLFTIATSTFTSNFIVRVYGYRN